MVEKRKLLLILLVVTFFRISFIQAQTYDWLRSSVNEFWFNQFADDCSKTVRPFDISTFKNSVSRSCSRAPDSAHINRHLSKNLVADLYLDEVLVETARQNQCQFDYWSALSTQPENANKEQEAANARLKTQFPTLSSSLTSAKFENRPNILGSSSSTIQQQAQAAQKKIVDQLVESAYAIAKEERELKFFLAQNPMYPSDPKKNPKEHIEKTQARIAILENSLVLSEDKEVQNFVRYDIIAKINESFSAGKEPDIAELKQYFSSDKKQGFQNQVVKRKLSNIAEDQSNYAGIDGKYDENYSFKVSAVQSGVGSKIINDKVAANPNFSQLQCELDSKYGKGEQIASTANTVAVAGVTVFFGGASLMLAKLAQIGLTSYRAARVAQIISTVATSSISASEIVQGFVESCTQPHFTKKDSTVCSRVSAVKESGISIQIDSEINHSQCLNDLGLAALAGATAFKTAMAAKRMKREQQILNLGIRDRYDSLQQSIRNHPTLTQAQKKQFEQELRKSIDLSDMNNFPRQEFLASLAKENPEDMIEALKQINGTVGLSWSDRVKKWISGKTLTKEESADLEACLVDQSSKTSQCNSIENDKRS